MSTETPTPAAPLPPLAVSAVSGALRVTCARHDCSHDHEGEARALVRLTLGHARRTDPELHLAQVADTVRDRALRAAAFLHDDAGHAADGPFVQALTELAAHLDVDDAEARLVGSILTGVTRL